MLRGCWRIGGRRPRHSRGFGVFGDGDEVEEEGDCGWVGEGRGEGKEGEGKYKTFRVKTR